MDWLRLRPGLEFDLFLCTVNEVVVVVLVVVVDLVVVVALRSNEVKPGLI